MLTDIQTDGRTDGQTRIKRCEDAFNKYRQCCTWAVSGTKKKAGHSFFSFFPFSTTCLHCLLHSLNSSFFPEQHTVTNVSLFLSPQRNCVGHPGVLFFYLVGSLNPAPCFPLNPLRSPLVRCYGNPPDSMGLTSVGNGIAPNKWSREMKKPNRIASITDFLGFDPWSTPRPTVDWGWRVGVEGGGERWGLMDSYQQKLAASCFLPSLWPSYVFPTRSTVECQKFLFLEPEEASLHWLPLVS